MIVFYADDIVRLTHRAALDYLRSRARSAAERYRAHRPEPGRVGRDAGDLLAQVVSLRAQLDEAGRELSAYRRRTCTVPASGKLPVLLADHERVT